jgi:hypothetical protein
MIFEPDPIPSLNPFLTKASTAVLAASRFAASTPLILELKNVTVCTGDTPKLGRSECAVSEALHQSRRATFDIVQ